MFDVEKTGSLDEKQLQKVHWCLKLPVADCDPQLNFPSQVFKVLNLHLASEECQKMLEARAKAIVAMFVPRLLLSSHDVFVWQATVNFDEFVSVFEVLALPLYLVLSIMCCSLQERQDNLSKDDIAKVRDTEG